MKRYLAIYTVGDETAAMSFVSPSMDEALGIWTKLAAEKHKTSVEEIEEGFEGEPCLCFLVDRNLGVWEPSVTPDEMGEDKNWEEVDTRAP